MSQNCAAEVLIWYLEIESWLKAEGCGGRIVLSQKLSAVHCPKGRVSILESVASSPLGPLPCFGTYLDML